MIQMKRLLMVCTASITVFTACNNQHTTATDAAASGKDSTAAKGPHIEEETVSYTAGNQTMKSFVAFDDGNAAKRPAVLIVPEWWGLNDYVKGRARQLAGLGYIAIAVDFYGDGKIADNPDSAGKWAMPFYKDPQLAKSHVDAAL
jgi:hypothetical protein